MNGKVSLSIIHVLQSIPMQSSSHLPIINVHHPCYHPYFSHPSICPKLSSWSSPSLSYPYDLHCSISIDFIINIINTSPSSRATHILPICTDLQSFSPIIVNLHPTPSPFRQWRCQPSTGRHPSKSPWLSSLPYLFYIPSWLSSVNHSSPIPICIPITLCYLLRCTITSWRSEHVFRDYQLRACFGGLWKACHVCQDDLRNQRR